jgi:predicted TIM-barrel fold metal-dependent hydrolase
MGADMSGAATTIDAGLIPAGACDCHMHVFGTVDDYPPAAVRGYTPRPASFADYRTMARGLGLSRMVLVQPSAYGVDNRCMTDTLRLGDLTVRAVAVIDETTPDSDLDAWHGLGVRGIRLNLASSAVPSVERARATLRGAAARVSRLGWHIQIFAAPALLVPLLEDVAGLTVPVVIDHMGAAHAAAGVGQPVVAGLIALLRDEKVWVKLSGGTRVAGSPDEFREALPIMRALIAANPARLVWGTDWPHIGPHVPGGTDLATYLPIDNAGLLRTLVEACDGDATLIRRILADNPGRLYEFGEA